MEEFLAYSAKTKTDRLLLIFGGVLFVLGGIALLNKVGIVPGVIVILLGAVTLYAGLTAGLSEAAALKKLEAEGKLQEVLNDFAGARSFVDDRVRFGSKYIFRPKLIKPIAYSDIRSVKYGHSTEHGTTDRMVYHVAVGTGAIPLNTLYSVNYPHPEAAEEMISIIQMHNPDVTVKT